MKLPGGRYGPSRFPNALKNVDWKERELIYGVYHEKIIPMTFFASRHEMQGQRVIESISTRKWTNL